MTSVEQNLTPRSSKRKMLLLSMLSGRLIRRNSTSTMTDPGVEDVESSDSGEEKVFHVLERDDGDFVVERVKSKSLEDERVALAELRGQSPSQRSLLKSLPRAFHLSLRDGLSDSNVESKQDEDGPAMGDERHRTMLRDLSKRFKTSKDRMLALEMTAEMARVQAAILDKELRRAIIAKLLPLATDDLMTKVHFCSAVHEYESMQDWKEKRRKGSVIVKTFIAKDSMFRIRGLPQAHEHQLLVNSKYEYLEPLKMIILDELASSEIIAELLPSAKQDLE